MTSSPNPEIHVPNRVVSPSEKITRGVLADLLISVRDQEELLELQKSQAQIIDLKEPRRGPLAPAALSLWQFADQLWQQSDGDDAGLLSAALGEQEQARKVAASLPPAFDFAKVGPSKCDTQAKLCRLWDEIRQSLNDTTELVAVAYADWKSANCL